MHNLLRCIDFQQNAFSKWSDLGNENQYGGSNVAWENSRHLATAPLASPPNEMSADFAYWWRVTTQIWVVSVSDWSCRVGNLIQIG